MQTMTLRDGRVVEYADRGDPAGAAVVFCHGTPATGSQADVVADAARAHGVRLVAPSRPGYGASSPSLPGLSAAARDVVELADALGLHRFSVMGVSGGGPFALALAAVAPERVDVVAVHAGSGAYFEVVPPEDDDPEARAVAAYAAGEVDAALALMTASADAELGPLRGLSDADFAAALRGMAPPAETWLDRHPAHSAAFDADFRRAVATSAGYVRDNLSWAGAWDVDLGAVRARVRLVYGESDGMVPQAHAAWLQDRLPSSELHVVPGGHGDACFGAAGETFAVVAAARGQVS